MAKSIESLNLGFSDAQNYTQRGNKQILSEVFVKNAYLTKLLLPNVYYLIGEKGTGKTAYAAFLSNNEYNNNKSILKYISGTDYEKFYELKKRNQIDISGYVDIWKTILLLLLAKSVTGNDKVVSVFSKNNLSKLMQASVYKGYKRDKIEMRGDRAEMSDFPLYLNTVAGGLDCRNQAIGGFSFVVKIYALPVVEIIGQFLYLLGRYGFDAQIGYCF